MSERPFAGLRVVDCSDRLSGAFAARLFGDWGADVVLAERPEGHALRREPPFLDDEPGAESGGERSVVHAVANWNKRSVVVSGAAGLAKLVADADMVVSSAGAPWGLDLSPAAGVLRGDAIHLSITPHGLDGPLAGVQGNDLTASARSGWSYINGYAEEPPLQMPGRLSGYVAGVAGFVAAAAALFAGRRDGVGQQVDVRELEALCLTAHPWAYMAIFEARGWSRGPGGGRERGMPGPLYQAADGQINFGFGNWHNWPQAMQRLGLPELGDEEALISDRGRLYQDMSGVIAGAARSISELDRWPLFHDLSRLRCIAGCVQDMSDLVADEQLAARGFLTETTIEGRTVRVPGRPVRMSDEPWSIDRAAPRLGEHTSEVVGKVAAGLRAATPPVAGAAPSESEKSGVGDGVVDGSLPLRGVRVLCFTQAWSGVFGTELLALLGADVVQIEGLRQPDVWRDTRGTVADGVRDESLRQHRLNTQGLYNSVNMNKRAIALDMSTEEGQAIFWEMVPRFDIVAENFTPHVMRKWGITLEKLAAARPGIIFASLSGYGSDGPYVDYPANGATTEPMSGMSSLHGYVGDPGMNTGGLSPDPISGYFFTAAILAALHRRERDGKAQRIDAAMQESTAMVVSDALAQLDATGRVRRPNGNRDARVAPHGVYAARGEDEWLALAAETEEAWAALAGEMGVPELAEDARFASMADRKLNEDALDALVGEWCARQDAAEAESALGALGCTAARVVRLYDAYDGPDPILQASGFLSQVTHPESGTHWLPGAPWRIGDEGSMELRPSPCLGEHSREVLREELGMDDARYAELVSMGVTGTIYDVEPFVASGGWAASTASASRRGGGIPQAGRADLASNQTAAHGRAADLYAGTEDGPIARIGRSGRVRRC